MVDNSYTVENSVQTIRKCTRLTSYSTRFQLCTIAIESACACHNYTENSLHLAYKDLLLPPHTSCDYISFMLTDVYFDITHRSQYICDVSKNGIHRIKHIFYVLFKLCYKHVSGTERRGIAFVRKLHVMSFRLLFVSKIILTEH